jgi:hypothetical protein
MNTVLHFGWFPTKGRVETCRKCGIFAQQLAKIENRLVLEMQFMKSLPSFLGSKSTFLQRFVLTNAR